MLLDGVAIFQAQRPDDLAPDIRKQRKLNTVARGEWLENVAGVIADPEDRDSLPFVIRPGLLQLDELRATVGSPARAAVENDQRAAIASRLVKIDRLTVLIRQGHVREPRANRRANVGKVDLWPLNVSHCASLPSSRASVLGLALLTITEVTRLPQGLFAPKPWEALAREQAS